jgi:hypothetical protein
MKKSSKKRQKKFNITFTMEMEDGRILTDINEIAKVFFDDSVYRIQKMIRNGLNFTADELMYWGLNPDGSLIKPITSEG